MTVPVPTPAPTFQVKALHPYVAKRPQELSFGEGEVILVTKKDSSGWWDAELKGKKGVIPGTFVQDYTPSTAAPPVPVPPVPVPVAVPVPASSSTSKRQCSFDVFFVVNVIFSLPGALTKVGVEFNGESRALKLALTSLEGVVTSLREKLSITSPITVQYFDPDLEKYVLLEDVEDLPKEKIQFKVVAQALSWWSWAPDASWSVKGYAATPYHSLLVKEGSHIHQPAALDKFKDAARWLGFNPDQAHKIFAISNHTLLTNFDNYRSTLQGKHRASGALFKKSDWISLPQSEQRKVFLDWFLTSAGKFEWNNDPAKPKCVPMLQGTSKGAVWQICQQGFGVVATTDDGFYGRGVYFTSKLSYAANYAQQSGGDGKVFLLSLVNAGNTFPVIEHPEQPGSLLGQACRPGYQSHFTIVDSPDHTQAFPTKYAVIDDATTADELVVFDHAQAVPVFVFYVK